MCKCQGLSWAFVCGSACGFAGWVAFAELLLFPPAEERKSSALSSLRLGLLLSHNTLVALSRQFCGSANEPVRCCSDNYKWLWQSIAWGRSEKDSYKTWSSVLDWHQFLDRIRLLLAQIQQSEASREAHLWDSVWWEPLSWFSWDISHAQQARWWILLQWESHSSLFVIRRIIEMLLLANVFRMWQAVPDTVPGQCLAPLGGYSISCPILTGSVMSVIPTR